MTTFAQAVSERRAPGATLVLEPWVFADEWSSRPDSAVCVGLRLLSDGAKTKARKTAEELADSVHPGRGSNWVECYNDCLMRQVVALGVCDPNDVTQPFELLRYAEDQVIDALTSKGAQFVFEALERHELASSPIGIQADSEDLERLAELLPNVTPEALPPGLRRLLSHVLEQVDAYADD